MATLEFFFDCSSPWTYLAFTRLPAILERTGATVVWRPILVGGVFNEVNRDVYDRRANPEPRKASYYEKDLQDWARLCGIRIGKPPVFPVRAVAVMRLAIAAEEKGALVPFARAAFETYWGDLEDISRPDIWRRSRSGPGWTAPHSSHEARRPRSRTNCVSTPKRSLRAADSARRRCS